MELQIDDIVITNIHPIVQQKIESLGSNLESIQINTMESLLGVGRFGKVYKHGSMAIKFSHMLEYINKFARDDSFDMYEFENEKQQILNFSELKIIFSDNIIGINYIKHVVLDDTNNIPVTMISTEYIHGSTHMSVENHKDVLYQLLVILLYANLNGYFHNDLKTNNIMVVNKIPCNKKIIIMNIEIILCKPNTQIVPVLVDYSFSKKITTKNKFPIECSIILKMLDKYDSIYDTIINLFENLNTKYSIYSTSFIEKFITNSGIFPIQDYDDLPQIDISDIFEICDALNKISIQ